MTIIPLKDLVYHLITKRVLKTVELIDAVEKIEDPQCELLLFRNCAGVSRLYFALRTTLPGYTLEAQAMFDSRLFQFLRHVITGDGAGFGPLQQRISTLPFRLGGFGVYTMQDTMHYCYLASCLQTLELQSVILRHTGITGFSSHLMQAAASFNSLCSPVSPICVDNTATHSMKTLENVYFDAIKKTLTSDFEMTERELFLWQSNQIQHALDFLLAIPITGLNQRIGARQFSAVLCYKLGIPLFELDSLCAFCKREMDVFGDHALNCANEVGIKYRHDLVRDTIIDICYRVGVLASKEVDLGLLAYNGTSLRPAYILVLSWDNGRDVCMDVTVVSPFAGGGIRSLVPGQVVKDDVARKNSKYLDKCTAQGYGFGALAFTTLGELGDGTTTFVKRLRNYLASHDANVRVGDFLFHRLSVVVQKGVGAQLVARLPTSFLSDKDVFEY